MQREKNHTTETNISTITSRMGTLFVQRREKIDFYLHTRQETPKREKATTQRNDELTALCNLITSYYSQLDRCLFYSFSISFLPSFSSAGDVEWSAAVRYNRLLLLLILTLHFSAPFHVGSLLFVLCWRLSDFQRWTIRMNTVRLKAAKSELHSLTRTIDWFGRLNSLFFSSIRCVES